MRSFSLCLIASLVVLACSCQIIAAEITVDGTLKAIDVATRMITVVPKKVGEKPLEIEVGRKAEITVDGKAAALKAIQVGQEVTITYDDKLEMVSAINAKTDARPPGRSRGDDEEATAEAMKALQGEWKCIAAEEIGKTVDKRLVKDWDRRVVIKGHTFSMSRTEKGQRNTLVGKFEIDASTAHFDLFGKEHNGVSREWIGIYELRGDTLKLCYRYKFTDTCTRPTKFRADDERPNICVFYIYRRESE